MPEQELKELKQVIENTGKSFEELNSKTDERLTQLEKKGSTDPLTEETIKKLENEVINLSEKSAAMQKLIERPNFQNEEKKEINYKKMVGNSLRKWAKSGGEQDVNHFLTKDIGAELEKKGLSVGSNPDGGYWIDEAFGGTLTTFLQENNAIRELASVDITDSLSTEWGIDNELAGYRWSEAETQEDEETATPQLGTVRIELNALEAFPTTTIRLLDFANLDVESWLNRKIGQSFAQAEEIAFLKGDGIKRPQGLMTLPAWTTPDVYEKGKVEQRVSGDSDNLTTAGLEDLLASLKTEYQKSPNLRFLLNRFTLPKIRALESANGQRLWQPSLAVGDPNTILGVQYQLTPGMDNVGPDALPIAVGDFKRAYQILDKPGLTMEIDRLTQRPKVKFIFNKYVGGGVVNFEAYKILKIST